MNLFSSNRNKSLLKSKTAWTGALSVLTGAVGGFTGFIPPAEAVQTVFIGLIGIFGRSALRD